MIETHTNLALEHNPATSVNVQVFLAGVVMLRARLESGLDEINGKLE